MSIFPQIRETTYDPPLPLADTISFEFDFNKGEFMSRRGEVVKISGQNRLRIWIHKLILTELDRYRIYEGTTYGMGFYKWFFGARDRDYIAAELEAEIRAKMAKNSEINFVANVEITFGRHDCEMKYTANTVYGEITEGVTIIGR